MLYQDYVQRVQQVTQLIQDAHYQRAVDALYPLIMSDVSDIDKADLCARLASVYDRMGNTDEALSWYEKGIAYEQNYYRYEVTEKKAQYLSQLGRSSQAVPMYETLMQQPFVSESEKERMRKVIQSLLGKAMRGWQ
jgi:tetratricopeptide (TPR) repeat protein